MNLAPFRPRLDTKRLRLLIETLDRAIRFSQHTEQKYFLGGGALMGFVRYCHLLPWDDDIDLHCDGFLRVDPLFAHKIGLRIKTSRHSVQFRLPRRRVMIEVFPLYHGQHFFGGRRFDFSGALATTPQIFHGVPVHVPKNPAALLDVRYGPTWRTHAVSPAFDHLRKKRLSERVTVPITELTEVVTSFRKLHGLTSVSL